MTNWIEYTGSDEQIAEMKLALNGFLVRLDTQPGREKERKMKHWHELEEYSDLITHYLICNPHPLADMIIRQAQTGQPVYIRVCRGIGLVEYPPDIWVTAAPDWNIPNAEYSFTEFKD